MVRRKISSFLLLFFVFIESEHFALGHKTSREIGGRRFLGFKEIPSGGNATFECSPSGPCVACLYSEKSDEKYRCSETGYRIPLQCREIPTEKKEANNKSTQKGRLALEEHSDGANVHVVLRTVEKLSTSIRQRVLLSKSTKLAGGSQVYTTYRSCIPAVNEEKLSVIGFEGIILGLLVMSGAAVYYKRKQTSGAPLGAMRIPTNPRF